MALTFQCHSPASTKYINLLTKWKLYEDQKIVYWIVFYICRFFYNISSSMYKMWLLCVNKKKNNQTVTSQSNIVEKDNPCIHIHDNSFFRLVHTLQRKVASVDWFYDPKYRYHAHVYLIKITVLMHWLLGWWYPTPSRTNTSPAEVLTQWY